MGVAGGGVKGRRRAPSRVGVKAPAGSLSLLPTFVLPPACPSARPPSVLHPRSACPSSHSPVTPSPCPPVSPAPGVVCPPVRPPLRLPHPSIFPSGDPCPLARPPAPQSLLPSPHLSFLPSPPPSLYLPVGPAPAPARMGNQAEVGGRGAPRGQIQGQDGVRAGEGRPGWKPLPG